MKRLFILCILLLSQFPHTSIADEAVPQIELQMRDKQINIPDSARQQISQQAVRLVESSNFHSDPGDKHHIFKLPVVQSAYRREVAGKFLLVSFSTPQKLKTVGGEVTVSQIVVGLNRDDYASNLFTIDDSGRIIGHSKYAGELCIQIFDTIKHLAP